MSDTPDALQTTLKDLQAQIHTYFTPSAGESPDDDMERSMDALEAIQSDVKKLVPLLAAIPEIG